MNDRQNNLIFSVIGSGGTTSMRGQSLAPTPVFRILAGTMLTSMLTTLTAVVVTGTLAGRLGPDRLGGFLLARRTVGMIFSICSLCIGMSVPRYMAMARIESERRALLLGGLVLGVVPGLLIGGLGIALHNSAARLLLGKAQDHGLITGALVYLTGILFHALLSGCYRGQGRMMLANAWEVGVLTLGPAAVVFGPVQPTEAGQILLC